MTQNSCLISNQPLLFSAAHFELSNNVAYEKWREKKLSVYAAKKTDLLVTISSLSDIAASEIQQIVANCDSYNMSIYQCMDKQVDSKIIINFATNFNLNSIDYHRCTEEDGISELTVSRDGPKQTFIPYSNSKLGWHTDGYYNQLDQQVRSMILHCAQPATEGGVNTLFDHEIAYIMLRDENPAYIKALMAPDCMTIPHYLQRQICTGPVFLVDPLSAKLQMRYTARKHNIVWKDDVLTTQAINFLTNILKAPESPVFIHKFEAGQGLITNNVLHNRTAFNDDPLKPRLVYRARFFDRITVNKTL